MYDDDDYDDNDDDVYTYAIHSGAFIYANMMSLLKVEGLMATLHGSPEVCLYTHGAV